MLCLVAQWCLILCDPMDCARLLCPWGLSRQEYWSGFHAFLQGIFPTQGSNPGLLHFRQILYQLSLCKRLNIQFKGKELRKVKGKGESLRESCIPDQPVFTEGWQGGGPTIQRNDSVIVKWQTSLTSQQERDFRFWQPLLRPSNHPSEAPGCPT